MLTMNDADQDDQTHFGYSTVSLGEKQSMVDDVFHRVASRYDLMNDLMSVGLHRAWKDVLVAQIGPSPRRALRHLDVAGGTGDVAFRVANAGSGKTKSIVLDVNADMLAVGKKRAEKARLADRVSFVEGNAESLPFESASFDVYSIAFGIRNVPRIELALKEAYRVLRHGGRFLCLEFSRVDVPGFDRIYDFYSFRAIPELGRLVTGDAQPYRYLVESIRKFPGPERFRGLIAEAGFQRASFTVMTGGIVAIHSGWKL